MKKNELSRRQRPAPAEPSQSGSENAPDFVPTAEDAARMAYLAYANGGLPGGCDVQHWIEAEARLLAECSFSRLHPLRDRKRTR